MLLRSLLIFLLILNSCTNKEDAAYKPTDLLDPYKSYKSHFVEVLCDFAALDEKPFSNIILVA